MKPESLRQLVGKNLKELRQAEGIEQQQFAQEMVALGFSKWVQQTVSNVEKGRRGLLVEEGYAVALILGTSLSEIIRINVRKPLHCNGLEPLDVPLVVAWLHEHLVIQLKWDKEARRPTGWVFSGRRGTTFAAFEAVLNHLDDVTGQNQPRKSTQDKENNN